MKSIKAGLAASAILTGAVFLGAGAALAAEPDLDPPAAYTVKQGDTLIGLGRRYFVSARAYRTVRQLNHVRVDRHLRPGSTLLVPGSLLKSEPITATVAAFSGAVTVDAGKGAAAPTLNMALGQGAAIVTGANAFITLQLPDDSHVTVPSQSRLRIVRLRHVLLTDGLDRVFAVDQGRSESTVTPMTNPGSRYLITTPVASSAVRGTVFRANFDDASGHATSEVVQGAVGVAGGGADAEAKVPAGFGAVTGASGPPMQSRLLPGPALVGGGRDQEGARVAFAIAPLPGAKTYRLQLANDAGFVDIFREALFPGPTADFGPLADGTYFVRATAIDDGGLEGLATVYSFTRELDTIAGGVPAVSGVGKDRRYLFRWSAAGAGVKRFRFQLFDKAEAMTPVVDMPGLSDAMVAVTNLKPGDYWWRVVATTFAKGKARDKAAEMQQLHIGG